MPTVLLINGYRFFFYMNEHLPIHVHIAKAGCKAKLELLPQIKLVRNNGFKVQELKEILQIAVENGDYLIQKWHETLDS
jgi:hypothetical protein